MSIPSYLFIGGHINRFFGELVYDVAVEQLLDALGETNHQFPVETRDHIFVGTRHPKLWVVLIIEFPDLIHISVERWNCCPNIFYFYTLYPFIRILLIEKHQDRIRSERFLFKHLLLKLRAVHHQTTDYCHWGFHQIKILFWERVYYRVHPVEWLEKASHSKSRLVFIEYIVDVRVWRDSEMKKIGCSRSIVQRTSINSSKQSCRKHGPKNWRVWHSLPKSRVGMLISSDRPKHSIETASPKSGHFKAKIWEISSRICVSSRPVSPLRC